MARKSEWQPAYVSLLILMLHELEFRKLSMIARMLWIYLRAEYRPNNKKYINSETGRIQVPMPYKELQKRSGFKSMETISKAFRELIDNKWIEIAIQGGMTEGMSWYYFTGKYAEFYNKKRGQKKRKKGKKRFIKVLISMLESKVFQELSIASQNLLIFSNGEFDPGNEICINPATGRKQVYFPYREIKKIGGFKSDATISKSFRELIDKNWMEKTEQGGLHGGKSAYSFKDDNLGFRTGTKAIKGIGDEYFGVDHKSANKKHQNTEGKQMPGITNPRHQTGSCLGLI